MKVAKRTSLAFLNIVLCTQIRTIVQPKCNLILMGNEPMWLFKLYVCKVDFCVGNPKSKVVIKDCYRHALHKHPLLAALYTCVTSYVIAFLIG